MLKQYPREIYDVQPVALMKVAFRRSGMGKAMGKN
jgi:hypothetical protein